MERDSQSGSPKEGVAVNVGLGSTLPNWHATPNKEQTWRLKPVVAVFFLLWVAFSYTVSHRGTQAFARVVPYADTF